MTSPDQDILARLRRTQALLSELEQIPTTSLLPAEKLQLLTLLLQGLGDHPDPFVSKLAQLTVHLQPTMNRRTLADMAVPIERALGRQIQDDDFLPRSQDLARPRGSVYPVRLVLDHWRSAFNVGSVVRSSEGLGVEGLDLIGYTPHPNEESVAKTAMGADIPWRAFAGLEEAVETLLQEGYRLVALETTNQAQQLHAPFVRQKTAFILGNERFGLGPAAIQSCHEVRELPLVGRKNSLNAAVVAALAANEWIRQWTS